MKPISSYEARKLYDEMYAPFSFVGFKAKRYTIFGAWGNIHLADHVKVIKYPHSPLFVRLEAETLDSINI